MIYLIITTSINNKYEIEHETDNIRKERYLYAISETLKHLPAEIIPIVVENNGKRETYLDIFNVFYTNNNTYRFKNKYINEMLDIRDVIHEYGIKNDDIIIKLTGRYRVLSSDFFKEVIEKKYDAYVKFYNVSTLQFEKYDCILGCYAIKAEFILSFHHLMIDNYKSAEVAFAKYVRFCGARLKEINHLDIEYIVDSKLVIV